MTMGLIRNPAVFAAVLAWLAIAALYLLFPSAVEGVGTGSSQWPRVVMFFFWMNVIVIVGGCLVGLGIGLAGLIAKRSFLPNVVAVGLAFPIFSLLLIIWLTAMQSRGMDAF